MFSVVSQLLLKACGLFPNFIRVITNAVRFLQIKTVSCTFKIHYIVPFIPHIILLFIIVLLSSLHLYPLKKMSVFVYNAKCMYNYRLYLFRNIHVCICIMYVCVYVCIYICITTGNEKVSHKFEKKTRRCTWELLEKEKLFSPSSSLFVYTFLCVFMCV